MPVQLCHIYLHAQLWSIYRNKLDFKIPLAFYYLWRISIWKAFKFKTEERFIHCDVLVANSLAST
jgi:hypothetical protein